MEGKNFTETLYGVDDSRRYCRPTCRQCC